MKAYLLILLIGFITSKMCALYTHGRIKGKYNSGGLFSSPSCTCIHGLIGLVDTEFDIEQCFCYQQSMINECKADRNCRFDNFVGCFEK